MMIGNPYKFSIIINTIDEWNIDDAFCNGVLVICVDGNFFPNEVLNATLRCEIPILKENLRNITIDKNLYNLPKNEAFVEIYNKTFPSDIDIANDYRFDITPHSLSDKDYFVFAISNGDNVRILACKLNYAIEDSEHDLKSINVSEAFVDIVELNKIISEIDIF